jgi:hypothetical protein
MKHKKNIFISRFVCNKFEIAMMYSKVNNNILFIGCTFYIIIYLIEQN